MQNYSRTIYTKAMSIYDDLIPEKKKKKEEELKKVETKSSDKGYGIYADLVKKPETTPTPTTTQAEAPKQGIVEKTKNFISNLFGKKKEQPTTPPLEGLDILTPKTEVVAKINKTTPIYDLASFDEPKVAGASARIAKPGDVLEPRTAQLNPLEKAFGAGIGDVISGTGKVIKWMGNDGLANQLISKGGEMSKDFEDLGGDWKDVHNPKFWVGQVVKGAPFTLSMLPLSFIGAEAGLASATAIGLGALGKTILSVVGGTALSTVVESAYEGGSAYDEALNDGKSKEEANKAAQSTMKGNVALLTFTNALQFVPFAKPFVKEATVVEKSLLKSGVKVVLTTGAEAGSEGFEELAQKNISLSAQGKEQDWLSKEAQMEFALGSLQGLVFTAGGTIIDKATGKDVTAQVIEVGMEQNKQAINEVQERMVSEIPGVKEKIDTMTALGVDKNQATQQILNETAEAKPEETKKIIEEVFAEKLEAEKQAQESIQPEVQVMPEVSLKDQQPDLSMSLNKSDYENILKPKIDALPELQEGEVAVIQSGTGAYVDTQIDEALSRGVNKNTKVEIVKESELTLTDNEEKNLRGERLLKVPAESSKIISNETQGGENQSIRTDNQQGQPADIVRDGNQEQAPAGENNQVSGGEVARGGSQVSNTSAGVRPTEPIDKKNFQGYPEEFQPYVDLKKKYEAELTAIDSKTQSVSELSPEDSTRRSEVIAKVNEQADILNKAGLPQPHIAEGIIKSRELTKDEVKEKAVTSLQSYIDRNKDSASFANDIKSYGQTFGDFEGSLNEDGGKVSIELADGRLFNFTAKEIFDSGKKPAPKIKVTKFDLIPTREGGYIASEPTEVKYYSTDKLQEELPAPVDTEAKQDLQNYTEQIKDPEVEKAFVNKWRQKAVEHNIPVQKTAREQVEINNEVEALIAEGKSEYSEAEKELMKQYSGAGGLERAGAEGRGLLDEYYTPKPIVDFMWKTVKDLGINKRPLVVEPSVGIGGYLSGLPMGSSVLSFELNKTSAKITKTLYPDATVNNGAFESLFIDDRGNKINPTAYSEIADLVIGNPPYGEHRGRYLGLGEEPKIVKYEEYFMKRGMDLLKKDGVMAYVVPSGFLANGSNYAKEEIAKLGYLQDAFRLPNGAFGTTTIGTDIVIFRKEPLPANDSDQSTYRLALQKRIVDMSDDTWFTKNPERILGTVSKGTGNYGKDEVKGSLESAIKLAEGVATKVQSDVPVETAQEIREEQVKEIAQTEEAVKSPEEPPVGRVPMSAEARKINEKAQIVPNKKYKTQSLNIADRGEMDMWQSVSVTGELNDSYTANFSPKTFVNKQVAISIENGIANYYPNILYYQGNIYEKLDNLELMKDKISEAQYNIQKQGLLAVLPTPQSLAETSLQPIADFVREIKLDNNMSLIDMFRNYMRRLPWEAYGSSSSWEVEGYLQGSVVNTGDKLQNIQVRKRRRDTGNSLFKRFLATELSEEQKKFIEDRYNRQFNAYYRPDYKQVPLLAEVNDTFNPKGESGKHPLTVKPIQKEGAAFLATKGAGLLAYDVGVGKTLTGIVAINEVMKRGWAKKPLVVVPNGTYQNWINEISEIIPGVKINSLMNLGAAFKGDLKTLEIEDGTLSIITYDGLVKLGFKDETYADLTGDLRDVMQGMNNTKRGAEKENAEIDKQIGRAIKGTTTTRFFEELGFDHITIDEVHNFKNIFAGAKLASGKGNEYRNVRGSSSARGIKAYLMAQYILKKNNNRNVFLLSATPFTNSPLEIYSIVSLMGKKRLEQLGLKNVNDFMTMFMELKPTFQVKANQEVKEEDVIEKFQNLQQLQKIVTEYIDFRTGEEAGVERPGREKRTVTLSQNDLQVNYTTQAQPLFNDRKNGGAIVAITELQNITLSPYLSRFSQGGFGYKEFVENSPKIKYAIEMLTQTLKDNRDAVQVIYMPRGVEEFPLVKEYLVKEKKFKPTEIAEITGGMSIDAKQKIMQAFNKGTVKVLLGTEAIKEGVNLQERATDLYHLHLPWNPTDMLQVEGRIWRQGNMWANVRIHYPLIENSVDSFIFQKLETKEKRIKNLWSYKDKEISVGDLNFEEMKLDLITDPMIRVKAEKTFETKKEQLRLEQLKVERSFTQNRITKILEAEQSLKYEQERLDRQKADATNTPEGLLYYERKVAKAQEEVDMWQRDLTAKGIDVEDLKKKTSEIDTQVTAQEEKIASLDGIFAEKIKNAENERNTLVAKENNFFQFASDVAKENKTFFVKRAGQKEVLMANANEKNPGGNASLGGYADVESLKKSVSELKTAPFPELIRLMRELTGDVPSLKPFKKALGRFYGAGSGKIKLNPAIFSDPVLANKVFAHEIGHLFDFLPEKTLTRGNIIGRLNSLNKFLRGTFGDSEVTNLDIRTELKDLSMLWKPFDELKNPGFTQYRYSSKELYADAISVLLNDPALLEEKAPTFYKEFFAALDSKPEVKDSYFKIMKTLNQSEETIINERLNDLDRMFDRGEEKQRAIQLEKQKTKFDFLYHIKVLFDDRFTPINRKVEEALKAGKTVSDETNPVYSLQNLNYMDSKIKSFLVKSFQPAYTEAEKVDGGWEAVGKITLLERAMYERGDMANPGGYDPVEARRTLEGLEKTFSSEDWATIQKAKELFRKGVADTVALAEKNKYYTPELLDQMKANKVYATYQVIDYMDKEINARIYKSTGTLKDVANPATSTVMKAIATLKAIEYNNARKDSVSLFVKNFQNDITPAKTFYNGKYNEPVNPMDRELGMVTVIEDGKVNGYYLEKMVADSLYFAPNQTIASTAKIMKWFTLAPAYRPLFTTMNLGFQSFNFVRDFFRYWKNIPDTTLKGAIASFPKAVYRYGQAVPSALARAGAKKFLGFTLPQDVVAEMESLQVLGQTYNDSLLVDENDESKQIERVMQKAGLLKQTPKKGLLKYLNYILDAIQFTGDAIESLPKVAGYIEMKDKLEPRELAYFLRNFVGSPDFRVKGELTPISNSIFLFSNAIKEGMKSDIKVATNPKTRLGFWWKTAMANLLPKAIMMAILAGLMGSDDDKKALESASENDKTNYTLIPLGVDENGKGVILRIPQDESGRLIGGLFWKLSKVLGGDNTEADDYLKDIADIMSFGAGQVPNVTPAWTGFGALIQFLGGKNPYDSFRSRYVVPDTEFKAGWKYSAPIFFDWLAKQQGVAIVAPGYKPNGATTPLQDTLNMPVVNNILGRWLKVTDYGQKEDLMEVSAKVDKQKAQESLIRREAVDKAVKEYEAGSKSMSERWRIQRQLVKDVIGTPRTTEEKTKATNLEKQFKLGIQKGKADPNIDALIYAGTNDEKVQILNIIQKKMGADEFSNFAREMVREGVMSTEVLKKFRKQPTPTPNKKVSFSLVKPAYANEKELAFAGNAEQNQKFEELKDWTTGEASYYNPKNPAETRAGTNGVGAYGRPVESGSVAFGNRVFHSALKKGEQVFIQVKGFENVKTPYGNGIFRVDDTMNKRYDKEGQYNIDFNPADLTKEQKSRGRYPIEFKVVEPNKPTEQPKKRIKLLEKYYA